MISKYFARSRHLAIVLFIGLGVGPVPAFAGGFGLALESEWTSAENDANIPFNPGRVNRDFDQHMGGVGFSYDTNIARDEPWNYRFKVGYRIGRREPDDDSTVRVNRRIDSEDPDEELISYEPDNETVQGFTLHQAVGYGFWRKEHHRIWAGPSVRLNVDWYGPVTNLDVIDVAIGAGPEIGINQHITDRLSVSLSASYNIMWLSESLRVTGKDRKFDGYQHMGAVALTIFWRTVDDVFEPRD